MRREERVTVQGPVKEPPHTHHHPSPLHIPQVGNVDELKYVCGEISLQHALHKVEALSILVCSEVALCCLMDEFHFHKGAMRAYDVLVLKDVKTGRHLLPALVMGQLEAQRDVLNDLLGPRHVYWITRGIARFEFALENLESQNHFRLKADQIVAEKFQVPGPQCTRVACALACMRLPKGLQPGRVCSEGCVQMSPPQQGFPLVRKRIFPNISEHFLIKNFVLLRTSGKPCIPSVARS